MKNDSSLGKFSKGATISTVGVILGGIFSYLTRKILLVNLTAAEYGFFYSAFSLACLGLAISDVGLGRSTTLLIAKSFALGKKLDMRRHYSAGFWFRVVSSLFLALLFGVMAPQFFREENVLVNGSETLLLLALFLPLQSLSGLLIGSLDALQRFSARSIYQALYYIIITVLVFAGFFTDSKLPVPAAAYLLAALALVVIGFFHLQKFDLKISFRLNDISATWRENWFYAKWISLSVMAINTMNYLDTLMLSKVGGLAAAADYQVALPAAQIGRSLIVIPVIFAPVASNLWQKNKPAEIARICQLLTLVMLYCSGAVVMFLLPFGGDLLEFLFDERYRGVSQTLLILGSSMPILIIAEFYLSTLNGIEKPAAAAKVALLGMLANILLNILLIPHWGPSGAAVATLLSYLVIVVMTFYCLHRDISLKISMGSFLYWLPVVCYIFCFFRVPNNVFTLLFFAMVYLGLGVFIWFRKPWKSSYF